MKKFASLLALTLLPQLGLAQQLTSADELQRLVAMPLKNIFVEYPNKTSHIQLDSTELCLSPRDLHPAFYGSFDWHSSVHSHWMLVEVLATQPQLSLRREIIAALDANLTAEKMRGEAAYFAPTAGPGCCSSRASCTCSRTRRMPSLAPRPRAGARR